MLLAFGFIASEFVYHFVIATIYHDDIKTEQKLTYHQYLQISCVAPEKWNISGDTDCHLIYYCKEMGYQDIYMKTYFDMLRLRKLYRRQRKHKTNIKLANKRAKLIKEWQKDINNYHDDYLEKIGVYLKEGKKL
jgi:hypothetical protein